MEFVDRHRLVLPVEIAPRAQPAVVVPNVIGLRPDQARGLGAILPALRVGIALEEDGAVSIANFVFIERARTDIRNKQLPDTRAAAAAHGVGAPVPGVEVTGHADAGGVGCPNGEVDAAHTVDVA